MLLLKTVIKEPAVDHFAVTGTKLQQHWTNNTQLDFVLLS